MKNRNLHGRFAANPVAMEDEGQKYRDRLRQLREALGVSQAEIGRRFGSAASTIGAYERGPNEVSIEDLLKFAEIFERTPQWIAFGHECPAPPPPPNPDALDRATVKNVIAAVIAITRRNDVSLTPIAMASNIIELSSLLLGKSAPEILSFVESLYLPANN